MESNQTDKMAEAKSVEFYKQAVKFAYETSMAYDKSVIGISIFLIYAMIAYLVPSINYWYEFFILAISMLSFIFSAALALMVLQVNKDYLIAMVAKNELELNALTSKLDKLDLLARWSFRSGMAFFAILAISNTAVKLIA